MHISHPSIDVNYTKDIQFSPGNMNVEVIAYKGGI